MGKQKKKKPSSPWRASASRSPPGKMPPPPQATASSKAPDLPSADAGACFSLPPNAQLTVPVIDLAIVSTDLKVSALVETQIPIVAPVSASTASSEPTSTIDKGKATSAATQIIAPTAPVTTVANPESRTQENVTPVRSWADLARGSAKQLTKKGEPFTLPSGEACVKIPNSVIEKNRKTWDCFVLGQFYSDPPSQGIIHNIVNEIWSRQYRDVTVSKMEGFAFLFRIPNASTRNRVINQRLWQILGQMMFVAKWEPCVIPVKPELSSAPIWLELRNVPLQFFHEEGLEHIAGLVGDPKFLHPSTANKTNLEVAKVFTLIDPRKPLPEAVNVQFDSGQVKRVLVSSPWMPPVCEHCKEIGHVIRRCPTAPPSCSSCKSSSHSSAHCPRAKSPTSKRKYQRKKFVAAPVVVADATNTTQLDTKAVAPSSPKALLIGECSGVTIQRKSEDAIIYAQKDKIEHVSEVEEDSSNVLSSEPEEEASLGDEFLDFTEVSPRRRQSGLRGKGLKHV